MDLESYLRSKRINKEEFSLRELKRKFPDEKERIERFRFLGLIIGTFNNRDIYRSEVV